MALAQDSDGAFFDALNRLGPALLSALEGFEQVRRLLHPPRIGSLRDALEPLRDELSSTLDDASRTRARPKSSPICRGASPTPRRTMRKALDQFCAPAGPQDGIARILGAMHHALQGAGAALSAAQGAAAR